MNNYYTFIITSTINTPFGKFSPEERFNQTLETIESIKRKVPNVKILLIDTSPMKFPEIEEELIKSKVDLFKYIEHNIVTEYFNRNWKIGHGEVYLMWDAMRTLRASNMIGKRIFKISGRYRLSDSFDIAAYENPELYNKYVGIINNWDFAQKIYDYDCRKRTTYFETRLWSFCESLFDEYENLIPCIYKFLIDIEPNYEVAHHSLLDHNKIIIFNPIHVEGYTAYNAEIKAE